MKKGISLIVLVITIIVMIILAAAIIISISNSNVINKANEAVNKTDLGNIKDAASLKYADIRTATTSPVPAGMSIGEYIEQELRNDRVIKDGQFVFINNQGGVEETVIGSTSDWDYTTDAVNNTVTLTKYKGSSLANLVIPNVLDNKKVVAITGTSATVSLFGDSTVSAQVGQVTISYGIKTIGDFAFKNCTLLADIKIPNSVTAINYMTFASCEALEKVEMSNEIKTIGNYAFSWDGLLTSINIPNTLTTIGERAFQATLIANITIPSSVTSLGIFAFQYAALQTVNIEMNGVISMGAFYGCEELTNVNISAGITEIKSDVFSGCLGLTSRMIPGNVKIIGTGAFYGCQALKTVTLNNGLESIKTMAFYSCKAITTITIPSTVTEIASDSFQAATKVTSILIKKDTNSIAGYATKWGATNATITWNVT